MFSNFHKSFLSLVRIIIIEIIVYGKEDFQLASAKDNSLDLIKFKRKKIEQLV